MPFESSESLCRGNISSTNEILPCGAKSEKELLIKKDKMSHFIKIDETYRFIKRILSELSKIKQSRADLEIKRTRLTFCHVI